MAVTGAMDAALAGAWARMTGRGLVAYLVAADGRTLDGPVPVGTDGPGRFTLGRPLTCDGPANVGQIAIYAPGKRIWDSGPLTLAAGDTADIWNDGREVWEEWA